MYIYIYIFKTWKKNHGTNPTTKNHQFLVFNIFVALVNSLDCLDQPKKKRQTSPPFRDRFRLPSGAAGTAPDAKAYIIAWPKKRMTLAPPIITVPRSDKCGTGIACRWKGKDLWTTGTQEWRFVPFLKGVILEVIYMFIFQGESSKKSRRSVEEFLIHSVRCNYRSCSLCDSLDYHLEMAVLVCIYIYIYIIYHCPWEPSLSKTFRMLFLAIWSI